MIGMIGIMIGTIGITIETSAEAESLHHNYCVGWMTSTRPTSMPWPPVV
jgi:hypothetical protein